MRVISLCVDGIDAAREAGLYEWLNTQDADVICLQDMRKPEPDLAWEPEYQVDGYFGYFFDSPSGDYSGVGIYTRQQPKAIMTGFGFASGIDMDGRYIQADFDGISVGSLLAPSASLEAQSQEEKIQFFDDLQAHLTKVTRKRREYIICGNWQQIHRDYDVQNFEKNQEESGALPYERKWMTQLFNDIGYVDAFRRANKDRDAYTWWPAGKVGEGDGWRTDLQVISESLSSAVEYGVIYTAKVFGSHAPLVVDYDIELF
ncbi:MAG: exodeoxyribonuclease III [Gammaproteobacteria bacterium]|jgi:exodeoxyribonuclease-3|nr:exodeoxyribonuclease III [Gammaproteobacteria bacterium]